MTSNQKNKFDPRSHIGETHGIFVITDMLDEKDKYGHYIYEASCKKCGYKKYAHYGNISGESGKAVVCNHIMIGGQYTQREKWENRRIGKIFADMKQRCYNKNDKSYKWYGDKSIKIYDEWLNNPRLFEEWAIKSGYKDNLTIDRIDENKDYSPDNCRWITNAQNTKYKSTTSVIDINGEKHTGREWSKKLGLGINVINTYIRKYGFDNTKEFIIRFMSEPKKYRKNTNQSYYELYMN